MAKQLHILTPLAKQAPEELIRQERAVPGDWVADFRHFPAVVFETTPDQKLVDVTGDLIGYPDYWTVARNWLADLSQATSLQAHLSIAGYGFWWSLNSQRFVPGLKDLGNVFVWIDLLQALNYTDSTCSILVYGNHSLLLHLVEQSFIESSHQLVDQSIPPEAITTQGAGLLFVRILMGILYLVYSFIRRPEICFVSNTNLLRRVNRNDTNQLRDIYLEDIADGLRQKGWRVTFIEKYGQNASWKGLFARGFFFPSDIIFILSAGFWRRLGLRKGLSTKWRKKWQSISPSLKDYFKYKGCDLSPFMMPLVRKEFVQHGPELETMLGLWKWILRLWRPKLIYVNNSYSHSAWPIIVASKMLNIPTVEQQHGLIGRNHLAYLGPRHISKQTAFPLCDVMVVWGDFTKRFLVEAKVYQAEQVKVCGFPRIDSLLDDLPSKEETLASLSIPLGSKVILYTSNGFAKGFMDDMLDNIAEIDDQIALYWIVKLHPREKDEAKWQAAVDSRKLKNVFILREFDFYSLLAACDMHVSFASTTLIEAAVLGKLNLGFKPAYTADPAGFLEAGAYEPVEPKNLGFNVMRYVTDSAANKMLLAKQRKFARDFCLHDGQSVSRNVDLIAEMVKDDFNA